MTTREICSRCKMKAPPPGSLDYAEWEVMGADEQGRPQLVCPGCLSGLDDRAITENALSFDRVATQDSSD